MSKKIYNICSLIFIKLLLISFCFKQNIINCNKLKTNKALISNINIGNEKLENKKIPESKLITINNLFTKDITYSLDSNFLQLKIAQLENLKEIDQYSKAYKIECTKTNCIYPNVCSENQKTCICEFRNAEYLLNKKNGNSTNSKNTNNSSTISKDKDKDYIYCNYKRKNQNIYFILEFLLNCGAGHIYAKNFLIGTIKSGLMFLIYFLLILSMILSFCGKTSNFFAFSFVILIPVALAIWVADSVLIGLDFYSDGNGVPLIPW
jgi:hypothetical protein